jgi:hypothetical protein
MFMAWIFSERTFLQSFWSLSSNMITNRFGRIPGIFLAHEIDGSLKFEGLIRNVSESVRI